MPTLIVNRKRVDISSNVAPDTPLLWILRDTLNLTGTKYGCGMALCGACTVHIDGRPTRSCQVQLSSIKPGAQITTIEGLKTKEAQAVQAAWQKLDVPQCGYCQSGQVMAAASLLAKNKKPTDPDIDLIRGAPTSAVVTVHRNVAGKAQHLVVNHRPRSSVLLFARLMGEKYAGTPLAKYFITAES